MSSSRASTAQKPQGLRVVCSKNFSRATFFVFWVFELFAREMNLKKKSSVQSVLNTYSTNILSLFLVLPSPFLPLSSFNSSMGRMPNICCNFTMTGINNFCPKIIRHSSNIMRPFSKLKILNCKKRFFLFVYNLEPFVLSVG